MPRDTSTVDVGGRLVKLSNLTKVLYPESGFTKGEVIDYYRQVADVLLPHLAERPLTRKRWPDGTARPPFFEKNTPRGTPEWVRTVFMADHGDDGVEYVVAQDLPTLVWLANLAALELHVPQWRVGPRGGPHDPDLVVFDLDPGAPADIIDCFDVAGALRQLLEADGLTAYPKTSGNKGAQLYVPIEPAPARRTSAYAKGLADRLGEALPNLAISSMEKKLRHGKVFIDWSQNNAAKTTIASYSLRGIDQPAVSTPLSWDEVTAATDAREVRFLAADVVARVERRGDLFADMAARAAPLPD
ncbi:MAG: ATP-dependent DNA ligase clustered with Ku protein, LigD [uncultured Nocardioidaceae bacterium]|uniref:ATP-dependent DNA ligase clustered with Ku protein, LigD n=1 Tax=uncultured Nocardioidaceae bacterium TaxID=253824 RepID=A0A6J4N281_9ACTN|nr:MAG: ATP-dependent DNA ligase clustered with Ku protein, LigD [uncultured Nocardioidaceae bacterium]